MKRCERGLTLVEMMIAIGLASVISLGVYYLFGMIGDSMQNMNAAHDESLLRGKLKQLVISQKICPNGTLELPAKEGKSFGQLNILKIQTYWQPGGQRYLDINYKIKGAKVDQVKVITTQVPPNCK